MSKALHRKRNQRLYSTLIYQVICMAYAALIFYAAYMLYAGADKMQAYFNGWLTAANDQLHFCLSNNF